MYSIIPLAGPDFINNKFGIKPLFEIESTPLIKKVLNSRSWFNNGYLKTENIIFILKDIKESDICEKYLKKEFKDCKIVRISSSTKGALMSSLAGASIIKYFQEPIIVDLVDVMFEFENEEFDIVNYFSKDSNLGGILPCFKSNDMGCSYSDIKNGYVVQSKEKKGWIFNKEDEIKSNGDASAGVYIFRNLATFLSASYDSVDNFKNYHHNQNLFVCPAMNGVIKQKKKVLSVPVKNIKLLALEFKV